MNNEHRINDNLSLEIFSACDRGDYNLAYRIVRVQPVQVNMVDACGNTSLHHACAGKHVPLAELLVEAGADVNATNDNGETPLHSAVWHPDSPSTKLVELLLDHGANPNARDNNGYPVLLEAAKWSWNSPHSIDVLLEHGAHYDLNSAVCLKNISDVRRMLQGDPHAVENSPLPNDLLVDSIGCESVQLMKLLIKHGADVNAPDSSGRYPITQVCAGMLTPVKKLSALKHLINSGADTNIQDCYGQSIMQICREAKRCSDEPEQYVPIMNYLKSI